MLPLIIAAGALLFLGTGKKKNKSSSSSSDEPGIEYTPRPRPNLVVSGGIMSHQGGGGPDLGNPGGKCDAPPGSPSGTYAAYGSDGKSCMVFWRPETWGIVKDYLKQEFEKLSKEKRDEICSRGDCIEDPFSMQPELLCNFVQSEARIKFVKKVVLKMYPQIQSSALPPPDPDSPGGADVPYFIEMVWGLTLKTCAREQCGFDMVT